MMENEVSEDQEIRFFKSTSAAKSSDIPIDWNTCTFCGAKEWIWPPHGVRQPCPFVKESAEQQELLALTHRNQQIALMQWMREHFAGETEDDDP